MDLIGLEPWMLDKARYIGFDEKSNSMYRIQFSADTRLIGLDRLVWYSF